MAICTVPADDDTLRTPWLFAVVVSSIVGVLPAAGEVRTTYSQV